MAMLFETPDSSASNPKTIAPDDPDESVHISGTQELQVSPTPSPIHTGIFIGDATILIRCAEAWIHRGHSCLGIVTFDARCAEWATTNGVPTYFVTPKEKLTAQDLLALTGGKAIDVVWSVHNVRILSAEVLALPRLSAINYHDALLPSYAGLYAPTWALMAGETRHGITWHHMVEAIDAGRILEQEVLAVTDKDTAWTLGIRCVEAAERAFLRILDRLERADMAGQAQSSHGHSYFGAGMSPSPGCVVDWRRPAKEIAAFVRALDFGPAQNPLGLPKALSSLGALAVQRVWISGRSSDQTPGTIIAKPNESGAGAWVVNTGTENIEIQAWTKLDGSPASEADCAALGIRVGEVLQSDFSEVPEDMRLGRLSLMAEGFWRRCLEHLKPLAPAGFIEPVVPGGDVVKELLSLPAPLDEDPEEALLLLLTTLARAVEEPFDVAFAHAHSNDIPAEAQVLYESAPPLRLNFTRAEMIRNLADHRAFPLLPADFLGCSRQLRERDAGRKCPVEVRVGLGNSRGLVWPPPDLEQRRLVVEIHNGLIAFTAAAENAPALKALVSRIRERTMMGRLIDSSTVMSRNVMELFLDRAAEQPESIAIMEEGNHHTYAELERRAVALSEALRRRGIGPGDVVALKAARLFDLVTAMLGIGISGAAFWAIDEHESETRRELLFREARPCALITDEPAWFAEARTSLSHGIIPIAAADHHELPSLPPGYPASPGTLVYLAFTSGSTGFPKAVAIEHHSLAQYIGWLVKRFTLGAEDRLLQVGSPAFDAAYEQIFGSLACGAALVAAPRPLGSAREIWRYIADHEVTVLDLPTALWHQLAPTLVGNPELWPGTVRALYMGGEAASSAVLAVLKQVAPPGFLCLNGYGPTETTIVATAFEVSLDDCMEATGILPIGWPVAGAIAEVCSENGSVLENGTVGELWIGGPGLARGYYGHPELTSRSFVMTPRGRRYRTGDCVSQNDDGCLIFHGRSDRQIKIGGRRVALEEVEMMIRGIEGVADVAVITSANDQLGAWLELAPGASPDGVTAEAQRRLPPAMRPRHYEVVASLPRTSSGKIEYKNLLPAQSQQHDDLAVAEHGPVAEKLAKCWCRALGTLPATAEDNFFAKGGDSLAAITLLAEIEKTHGVAFPLVELMLDPTPAGISRHITTYMTKEDHRKSSLLPSHSVVIEMRSGKDDPLVLVHGLGGHLLRLRPLAMSLPEGTACWGIQAPGIDDAAETPRSIEALAKLYLSELTPRLGGRKLEVCGMSFGGVIALEMARQHAAQGGSIGLVGLFDTELKDFLPGSKRRRSGRTKRWLRQFRRSLRRRIRNARDLACQVFGRLRREDDQVESPHGYRNFLRIRELSEAAMNNYSLKPQPVPTYIFASTDRPPEYYEKLAAQLKCDIKVIPVPGSHMTMLDAPHVETLAREILAQRARQQPVCSKLYLIK